MARLMEIVTPLGEDVLLFHGMHAREELSRLSEFHLDLLSSKPDLNVDDILGKNVTVKFALPDDATRFFNGYVTRFAQRGKIGRYYRYLAEVRPWLWFLTRTADCRIFQEMTVPDILKKVFADHGMNDFKMELTGSYRKWVYCVQYRETDFNFVSRLMEEEGIYFYFRHTDGHNTMVLTDSVSSHTPTAGYEELRLVEAGQFVRPGVEHISSWEFSREIQPGVYVHDDYDLTRPSVDLEAKKTQPRGYTPSDYEIYDYPGHYVQKKDGEAYAGVRIEELASQFETSEASTNARGVCVGTTFTLTDSPRADQNREYLILNVSQELQYTGYEGLPPGNESTYRCHFVAMPTEQQFRPRRLTPKPFVQGPQTAVVVGPSGDEIYVDEYGRVKVQFHWDRYGKKDENSSCWVRVSSPWAGKNWGMISTPRIGQEVIVAFLEGDPDQPIITGRVYNAEQVVPYALPANKTQSGMKSRSSKDGSPDNFNEIRFEDLKGSEEVYVHAEKDMNRVVENNDTLKVGFQKKDKGDQTIEIFHDRTETVGNDETITIHGNRTETVDKDETITIHKNRTETVDINETIQIGGNRSITVAKSEDATVALQRTHTVGINETITVGAAQQITVGAAQSVTVGAAQAVAVGGNQSTSVGGSQSNAVGGSRAEQIGGGLSQTVAKDVAIKVSGGRSSDIGKDDTTKVAKNFLIDAGDSITIKSGSASITMKKDGTIAIKGKDIAIEGTGKINIKASSDVVVKGSKVKLN